MVNARETRVREGFVESPVEVDVCLMRTWALCWVISFCSGLFFKLLFRIFLSLPIQVVTYHCLFFQVQVASQ